jgi:hypothetical protein
MVRIDNKVHFHSTLVYCLGVLIMADFCKLKIVVEYILQHKIYYSARVYSISFKR